MTSKTFTSGTVIDSAWLNDVNNVTYNVVPSGINGLRNRIINGSMIVDQRNNGSIYTLPTVNPATSMFCLDRWIIASVAGVSTSPAVTAQQISSTTLTNRLKVITTDTNIGNVQVMQRIESKNVKDIIGKSIMLSFNASSDISRSLIIQIFSANTVDTYTPVGSSSVLTSGGTVAQVATTSITTTSTDTRYTVGPFTITANTGIQLALTFQPNGVGQYISLGDVQFEVGTVATAFEQRPVGLELSLCKRYLPAWLNEEVMGMATSSTTWRASLPSGVPIGNGASTTLGGGTAGLTFSNGSGTGLTVTGISQIDNGRQNFLVWGTVASGLTTGQAGILGISAGIYLNGYEL